MNAMMVSGSLVPPLTLEAAIAVTETMPRFINTVIIGFTAPMVTPALVSSLINALLTLS